MAEIQPDILILGGGIAGLWTCAVLAKAGLDVLCVETASLGATQSIGAQGIIHGGMKYALTGQATRAAQAIAGMPPIWADCLAGRGELDLSAARVQSDHTLLWTTPGLLAGAVSRFAARAAKTVLRTEVTDVPAAERTGPFAGVKGIDVYRVGEPVLDVASVLAALAELCGPRLRRVPLERLTVVGGARPTVTIGDGDGAVVIRPRMLVGLAGPGNAAIATAVGATGVRSQLRPLAMVMARARGGAELPAIFGHCLGASNLPRLTVTTGRDGAGRSVWYLGGTIAERGASMEPEPLRVEARAELDACLPWLGLGARKDVSLAVVRWDRAECQTADGSRPDEPVLLPAGAGGDNAVYFGWPTKLAFAPRMAELVGEAARSKGISGGVRSGSASDSNWLALQPAQVAPLPWDDAAAVWS